MRRAVRGALAACALCLCAAPAAAQNLSLRAPAWAQSMLASDVIATTGGRAALAAPDIEIAARVTIAPAQGGVARVIRYEARETGARLALRRFTGHPSTGWWLWGADTPLVRDAAPALDAEVATLVRAAMSVTSLNASSGEACRGGEQAFVEMAVGNRAASATRLCVAATDPVGRLALRLSEAAGSRTEEQLAAAAIEEVLEADRAFAARAAADGVPAAFAHYAAADAIMLRGAGDPIMGRDGVAARFAQWPAGARLEWTPQAAHVSARGDMAWSWGESVYIAPDGTRDPGRYVSIWKRDDDGAWRFALDAGVE